MTISRLTTSDRLKQIMNERGLKQVDILEACKPYCEKYGVKLAKNDLSQYISGKVQPGQDKLTILGHALKVNEVWLMGYNVPPGIEELKNIELNLSNGVKSQELIENQYGKPTLDMFNMYNQLDEGDKGEIRGEMKSMLKAAKYDTLKNRIKERIGNTIVVDFGSK